MSKNYERRYHATWRSLHGRSSLERLASWANDHGWDLSGAPCGLLNETRADVARRLALVATREPTRRHRKHFSWLLGWYGRITKALFCAKTEEKL